jgi:hypothetical protein
VKSGDELINSSEPTTKADFAHRSKLLLKADPALRISLGVDAMGLDVRGTLVVEKR